MNKAALRGDEHVLIVLTGSLGDLVRGFSVAAQLKKHAPGLRIDWLVDSTWAELCQVHPAIEKVYIFERGSYLGGKLRLVRELRSQKFDICLDLQRHFKSGTLARLSGAPRRIGFNRRNCKEFNFLFQTEEIPACEKNFPKMDHYQLFLRQLGVEPLQPYIFGFEDYDLSSQRSNFPLLEKGNTIGLVLSSSMASKDWPIEGYQKLIERLLSNTTAEIVLLGTKRDQSKAQTLLNQSKSPRLHSYCGQTSLVQLLAVIQRCQVLAGPDSGAGHIAAAVQTPYVALFGPSSERRVSPYRNEHLVVSAEIACRPCNRRKCPGLDKLCMRLITADQVWKKIEPALQGEKQVLAK